jgi:hypothetical protein
MFMAGLGANFEFDLKKIIALAALRELTSLVVYWSEFLATNHEVPGSIPGSAMGIFAWGGRIPMVTMVWIVGRFRVK